MAAPFSAYSIAWTRCRPSTSIDVTHRTIDPDQEALEEMRAARKLGATRAKLLELYGANGLDRLEALEAVDNARRADAAKIIEHQPEAGHDR